MQIDAVWMTQDNEYVHVPAASKYQCGVGSESGLLTLHSPSKGWSLALWESLAHSHLTQWGEDFGFGSKGSLVWAVPIALVEEGTGGPMSVGTLGCAVPWALMAKPGGCGGTEGCAAGWESPGVTALSSACSSCLNRPSLYLTLTGMGTSPCHA